MKFLSLAFLGLLIFGFLGLGYMHEQVHVAIYDSYGIESNVEYFSNFPHFVTIPEEGCLSETCNLAHQINEAIFYPLMVFYGVFGLGIFIIILLKEYAIEIEEFKLKDG